MKTPIKNPVQKPPSKPASKTKNYLILKTGKNLGRKGRIVTLTDDAASAHKANIRPATKNDIAISGRR